MDIRDIILQYRGVTEECLRDIDARVRILRVNTGCSLVRQGQVCDAFYFNRSGLMRVSHRTVDADNTILFGAAGDIFTSLHSYFAAEPSAFSLIALEESEVYELKYRDVEALLTRHPDFMRWLMYIAIGQLYALERRYVKYATTGAEQRFRNFMAQDQPYIKRVSAKVLTLRIPLKYIASYLQITPATLSRLRRKLARE